MSSQRPPQLAAGSHFATRPITARVGVGSSGFEFSVTPDPEQMSAIQALADRRWVCLNGGAEQRQADEGPDTAVTLPREWPPEPAAVS
jgi:hypothetical protein